jgi:hypothetical protein
MKKIILSVLICLLSFSASAQDEDVIYSFRTVKNKVVQLILNESNTVLTFRLFSKDKIELEVSDDLTDADTVFSVYGYHRGGGAENAAMDYNNVTFSNNGYDYEIYYVWAVNEEDPDVEHDPIYGLKIYKDGIESVDLKGKEVITGSVYGWSFYDILPVSQDN